ncbi:hypothetical protein ACROYT_G005445 [Oculina patagonica]
MLANVRKRSREAVNLPYQKSAKNTSHLLASNNFQQGSTFAVQTGGHGYYYYATALEVDWPCHPKEKRIHHKDSSILDTRRKAQAWQAQEYMATYSRDRIEGLKPKLEHHPTAGQRQTAVEDLCCCPTCQWAQWAVTEKVMECLDKTEDNASSLLSPLYTCITRDDKAQELHKLRGEKLVRSFVSKIDG